MTTSYIAIGVLASLLHLGRKVYAHPGPIKGFFQIRDNVWYLVTTPLMVALGMYLPEIGAALGMQANAWAGFIGWTGGSAVSGFFDVKSGTAERKAAKAHIEQEG
mgnify:CR=1 FL=1